MVRTAAHNAKIAAGMRAYHSRCKAGGAMTGRRGRSKKKAKGGSVKAARGKAKKLNKKRNIPGGMAAYNKRKARLAALKAKRAARG